MIIFLERPHLPNCMQLSWLMLEETLLSHCSELTLVWRRVGIPKNSWISHHQLTFSIVKSWWSKTSISLRKILCIYLYLPTFEGLRKGKQRMSRSYLNCSWAKYLKTKGFYTARKWVHCHWRCVSENWNFLYAFQLPKNVIFTNALLGRKFQNIALNCVALHMLLLKSSAVSLVLFPCFRVIWKKLKCGSILHHIDTPEIQKVKNTGCWTKPKTTSDYHWKQRPTKQGRSLGATGLFHYQKAKVQSNLQRPIIYECVTRFTHCNQLRSSHLQQESLFLRMQLGCLYLIGTVTAPVVSVECPWI